MKSKFVVAVSVLLLLVIFTTWALAETTHLPLVVTTPEMTSACVNNSLGTIRILEEGEAVTCADSELLIQWNVTGAQGPQGEQGPPGVLGFYTRTAMERVPEMTLLEISVYCDEGDQVTGGGFETPIAYGGTVIRNIHYFTNGPVTGGWKIGVWHPLSDEEPLIPVYVICADTTP